jgi:hypothetical protein
MCYANMTPSHKDVHGYAHALLHVHTYYIIMRSALKTLLRKKRVMLLVQFCYRSYLFCFFASDPSDFTVPNVYRSSSREKTLASLITNNHLCAALSGFYFTSNFAIDNHFMCHFIILHACLDVGHCLSFYVPFGHCVVSFYPHASLSICLG